MAEENAAPEAEIDVDAMDDAQFADLKSKMREEPAKEPEKPAEPEPVVDDKATPADDLDLDEPTADGKKRETVPHATFHRANERRKAAEAAAQTAQATANKAMERLQALLDAQREPEPDQEDPATAIPDDNDPIALLRWTKAEILARKQAEAAQAEASKKEQSERQAFSQMFDKVNADFSSAVAADPSISDAHKALRGSIAAEMEAIGYSQQEIAKAIIDTENQHLAYIAHNKLEVGPYIKKLAAARGWQAKAAPTLDPPGETDADRINKREELRLASLSLGKGGGAVVNTGDTTPEQLLDMSDTEFEAYKKKHGSVRRAFERAS